MLWNSALETGIQKVDDQHKELFRQIDILLDNKNKERIAKTLDFLGKYVVLHFSTEETMQAASEFPQAAEHKELHRKFVATFKELRQEYDATGYNLVILMKVNNAVITWLREHIMGADKEFADYYKGRRRFHS
ncbi:MAG: bacteriohemerythrin [Planctomycetes bacterium]|nr:bacteriohemerythrin [Planctomycetota bacterium]